MIGIKLMKMDLGKKDDQFIGEDWSNINFNMLLKKKLKID
jgi:hypothetical protein